MKPTTIHYLKIFSLILITVFFLWLSQEIIMVYLNVKMNYSFVDYYDFLQYLQLIIISRMTTIISISGTLSMIGLAIYQKMSNRSFFLFLNKINMKKEYLIITGFIILLNAFLFVADQEIGKKNMQSGQIYFYDDLLHKYRLNSNFYIKNKSFLKTKSDYHIFYDYLVLDSVNTEYPVFTDFFAFRSKEESQSSVITFVYGKKAEIIQQIISAENLEKKIVTIDHKQNHKTIQAAITEDLEIILSKEIYKRMKSVSISSLNLQELTDYISIRRELGKSILLSVIFLLLPFIIHFLLPVSGFIISLRIIKP